MKKKTMAIASMALAGAVALSLCGCSLLDGFGNITYAPPSVYEIATEQGYHGTEGGWLSSLVGDNAASEVRVAYEEAQKEGFTGSFLDFLQEYLTVSNDDSAAVNRALMSAVSIYAIFTTGGDYRYPSTAQSVASIGSGVIYSLNKEKGDAYVITNYHVVYNVESNGMEKIPHISDDISLYLYGGKLESGTIKATYVGGAMEHDIAVLKVENSAVLKNSGARACSIGDSDAITVGDRVYAIGDPKGDGISAVDGIVSVEAEYLDILASDERTELSLLEIRTDAAVNHGNSGGGLFSADGKLIGIVNARTEQEGVVGFGYAIPANLAISIAQNIIDHEGNGSYGALRAKFGITVGIADSHSVFDEVTQKAYIVETTQISSVEEGSASYGKLKANDVIYSITVNGHEQVITRFHMINALLFTVRKDATVTVKVYRNSELVSVDLAFDNNSYFLLFD